MEREHRGVVDEAIVAYSHDITFYKVQSADSAGAVRANNACGGGRECLK
jgi:hypothetical protein